MGVTRRRIGSVRGVVEPRTGGGGGERAEVGGWWWYFPGVFFSG